MHRSVMLCAASFASKPMTSWSRSRSRYSSRSDRKLSQSSALIPLGMPRLATGYRPGMRRGSRGWQVVRAYDAGNALGAPGRRVHAPMRLAAPPAHHGAVADVHLADDVEQRGDQVRPDLASPGAQHLPTL